MGKLPFKAEDFGQKLSLLLAERKMSQLDLAQELEVHPGSVNHFIKGNRIPSREFLLKLIARFPEVDLNWLLREDTPFLEAHSLTPRDPLKVRAVMKEMKENIVKLEKLLSQR